MAIVKINKNRSYSAISNYHLRDKTISWKAKGLLSTMLSLPEDWDFSTKGLQSLSADGDTSTRSVIQEVLDAGYLVRSRLYKHGKLFDWLYTIYEQPVTKNKRVCKSYNIDDTGKLTEIKSKENKQQDDLYVENQQQGNLQQGNLQQGFPHDYIINNKSINNKSNEEFTNINSCAQPAVEHENTTKILDSAKNLLNIRPTKQSLIPQVKSDLEELKSQVKKPTTTKKSTELKNKTEDTKDFKKNSFLRKAVEIAVSQTGIVDEEKIALIKDWLDVCYNKGVKTSEPRFAHIVKDLDELIKNYPWEKVEKILHSAIVSGYSNLNFAIQNTNKPTYNKAHTKADEYKFPGIKPDETVDDYVARTYESPEDHQARIKQMQEDVKAGKLKTF